MNSRRNGVYYTPFSLATFISDHIIINRGSRVLDPCFGRGSLLIASHDSLRAFHPSSVKNKLFGYDIDSSAKKVFEKTHSKIAEKCNLEIRDFFTVGENEFVEKFDVILMNPPFVRHHLIDDKTLKSARNVMKTPVVLPRTSDLWAYFILHSLKFIKKHGHLAAILPWSFLFTFFAKSVRERLLTQFSELEAVVLGDRLFEDTDERILVLFGKGFEEKTRSIKISYSKEIPTRLCWLKIDRDTWINSPWKGLFSDLQKSTFRNTAEAFGFRPLKDFAKVKIGTVTGANDFFIINKNFANKNKFQEEYLRPVVRKARDLSKLSLKTSDVKEYLLVLTGDNLPHKLENYISEGEKRGLSKRYHTRKRDKWYSIPDPVKPDGFLCYMTKEVPFIVLDNGGVLSTNGIHQLFFEDNVDNKMKKWIQLSLFTSVSQLSVELEGRTYGGGILKLEPTAAGNILVFPGNGKSPPEFLERRVNKCLSEGRKDKAIAYMNDWFIKNGLQEAYVQSVTKCYNDLKNMRLSNDKAN